MVQMLWMVACRGGLVADVFPGSFILRTGVLLAGAETYDSCGFSYLCIYIFLRGCKAHPVQKGEVAIAFNVASCAGVPGWLMCAEERGSAKDERENNPSE